MKTLDIFEGKNKTIIRFDEIMYSNGAWNTCSLNFNANSIVKLNYKSDDYDYFLHQNNSEQVLLRNKK